MELSTSSRFFVGQRVSFFDDAGNEHYGTVHWSGKKIGNRSFKHAMVGIHTVRNKFRI